MAVGYFMSLFGRRCQGSKPGLIKVADVLEAVYLFLMLTRTLLYCSGDGPSTGELLSPVRST